MFTFLEESDCFDQGHMDKQAAVAWYIDLFGPPGVQEWFSEGRMKWN